MAHAASARWIVGPAADGATLFGGAAVALLVGALVVHQPSLLPPLLWAWLLLIDGPHLVATGLRSSFDPACRAADPAWRQRLAVAFAWPLAAFALAQAAPALRTMDWLAAAGALFSWYHLTRQHEGIYAIFHAQTSSPAQRAATRPALERRCLRVWLWSAYAAFALSAPVLREAAREVLSAAWDPLLNTAAALAIAAVLLAVAAYLREGWRRARMRASLRPWWFGLLPVGLLSTIALAWVGAHEPLVAGAQHPDQWFLAVTLVTGIVHGTQYLFVVLAANRRRHTGGAGLLAVSAARPWATLLLCAAVCAVLYLALNASRGTLPGAQWFDPAAPAAQLALALYWGLFFHHFFVDARIWRVRDDAALRRELGIE